MLTSRSWRIATRLRQRPFMRISSSSDHTIVASTGAPMLIVDRKSSSSLTQPTQQEEVELIREINESQRNMMVEKVSVIANLKDTTSSRKDPRNRSIIVAENLVQRIESNAWKRIENNPALGRVFWLDSIPMISSEAYHENISHTVEWLHDVLMSDDPNIILYVGFEAFYDLSFDSLGQWVATHRKTEVPIVFSPLVKSCREYIQQKQMYEAMEYKDLTADCWSKRTIVHLGASHGMDRILFQEDSDGYLQRAWNDGQLIILSPELTVVDDFVYRTSLSQVLDGLSSKCIVDSQPPSSSSSLSPDTNNVESPRSTHNHLKFKVTQVQHCDYAQLDKDILAAKHRVADAQTMEEAFAEVYRFVTTYMERRQLDCPCYFDSGWESFYLYKSVSKTLDNLGLKIPWTRVGLINARNAAIGDSLHTFYATTPDSFPLVVCGDTAGLLAGGISMVNIHAHNRFGVVVVLNNRGMAIEDVISKRSVDGHQYQYEYVRLDSKRDIFTLAQLKDVIQKDVFGALRDYLWGVAAHRTKALILNIDVQSLRRENANKVPTDAILMGRSFLDDDFGERFALLEGPRKKLEGIIDVLHHELNAYYPLQENREDVIAATTSSKTGSIPVKIVGCSAIEYMEIVSQLTMVSREKLKFLPTPTDLLATRTLLPSLVESPKRTVSSSAGASNFVNSNHTFSVFISNAAFGLDGLNNLISTHLEYGTGTMVHLAYDAAEFVTHYSLIGQIHRNFGIRPSTILPSLCRNHQAYKGQVLVVHSNDEDLPNIIRNGLQNPDVKVILVDMGAPNLTASLK